jgi:hypothetical protein
MHENATVRIRKKRKEKKRKEKKRKEKKRKEKKRNETKRNETKRNETKRNENGRFASKVGFSSELESTRNVGNQRCCNMQNNNSQHLYTRFIRRIAGASILCSLLACQCTVLRMESRLLLPRGSLTYS